MKIRIRKWGNGAAVRIPASVMQAANLSLGRAVSVKEEHGRIVIEPERAKVFSLEDLVRGITSANLHCPIDTGSAVGREVW